MYILLIAFGMAATFSLAATYALDYLDPSFHNPAQVFDILGVPVVVAIPKRTA
jgi:capsular polysaccharide biosynthesis protein